MKWSWTGISLVIMLGVLVNLAFDDLRPEVTAWLSSNLRSVAWGLGSYFFLTVLTLAMIWSLKA